MKKFLTSTIVLALVAALFGVFVACGNTNDNSANDKDTAQQAIASVRNLYENKSKETPADYDVTAVIKVDKYYDVVWTIESDSQYKSNITVGERNGNNIKIGIVKATEAISYKLVATVTVGKESASASFDRIVPAGQQLEEGQIEKTISFVNGETSGVRGVYNANQQVWTQNGITLTNDKGGSSTAVNNASSDYHIRLYSGSSIKIEYPAMTKLIFYSEAAYTDSNGKTTDYPAFLKSSLEAANLGTVTASTKEEEVDEKTVTKYLVTLELAAPADAIEFTAAGGQCRLTQLDIVANKATLTDEQKANGALAQIAISQTNYAKTGAYDLPATKGGLNITWTLKAASDYASISSGKLNITSMPETETTLTLVASVTSGEVTKTKEFEITVAKPEAFEVGTYNIVLDLRNAADHDKKYYFNGTINTSDYGVTSENAADAAEVVVAVSGEGYTLKVADKYIELYLNSSSKARMTLVSTPTGAWTYDYDLSTFTWTISSKTYYIGTYTYSGSTYTTINASETSYISGNNASTVGKTQFPITMEKVVEKTPAEKIAAVKPNVDIAVKRYAEIDGTGVGLPTEKNGVSLSWAVKETSTLVEIAEGRTLRILATPEENTQVVLVVTLRCGEGSNAAQDTKEITITVVAPTPFEGGTYKMALQQVNLSKKLYFNGALSGNFGAMTEYPVLAADVVVTAVSGAVNQYTFAVGNKYLELESYTNSKDNIAAKLVLVDSATKWWKYDYSLEVFTWTHIEGKIYYLGTYGTYDTMSASETSYISGDNANKVGTDQFIAKFEEYTATDADKIAAALSVVGSKLDNITEATTVELATSTIEGVAFTWTLPADATAATITNSDSVYSLVVSNIPEEDVTLTLTVSASCGEATAQTKTVTVTIKAPVVTPPNPTGD